MNAPLDPTRAFLGRCQAAAEPDSVRRELCLSRSLRAAAGARPEGTV
jgi:hypothetical protein